jgi:hypothetical protein
MSMVSPWWTRLSEQQPLVTRDQMQALTAACRMAQEQRLKEARVYVVEVAPDGWGACREYHVEQLPPPGSDLAAVLYVGQDLSVVEHRA